MLRTVWTAVSAAFVVAVCAAAPAAAQDADVLAPPRAGQVQCYEPDAARKTCKSINAFRFEANGIILSVADSVIMPEPVVAMRIVSPVTVRNGAVCGPTTANDLNNAHFTINGQRASDEDTAALRAQLVQQLAPLIDVDTCISLTAVDGGFRADTALNGRPQPQLAQRVIWIRPEDGYTLSP